MRGPISAPTITLRRPQLYMLPTRYGLWFTAILGAILLAAVNYNNGLAYMFTFLLGAMAVVSMLYTHRNVSRLRLTPGPCAPVFAGETASAGVWLHNDSDKPRYAVSVIHAHREVARVDLAPHAKVRVDIPIKTTQRGWLPATRFYVTSRFPLGLLFTWSREMGLPLRGVVYPSPGPPRPFTLTPDRRRYQEVGHQTEGDDFAGLRDYRRGDSPRHVHWKAVARGQGMYTKEFSGAGQDTLWLDWDALPELATEARLAQLCRWAIDAEREELRFGLNLPGVALPADRGERHRHQCLKALALYGLEARASEAAMG